MAAFLALQVLRCSKVLIGIDDDFPGLEENMLPDQVRDLPDDGFSKEWC